MRIIEHHGGCYTRVQPKRSGMKFKGRVEQMLMHLSTPILSASSLYKGHHGARMENDMVWHIPPLHNRMTDGEV